MSDELYIAKRLKELKIYIDEFHPVIKDRDFSVVKDAYYDILNRVFNLIESMVNRTPLEIFEVSKEDPFVFAALWLSIDGNPLLFTPTQQESVNAFLENDYVWVQCHRRYGKSLSVAFVITLINCMFHDISNKHLCFAPVGRQQYVWKYIRDFHNELSNRDFFKKNYLSKDTSFIRSNSVTLDNGNSIISASIGVRDGGQFSLGGTGDCISIDEIELLPPDIYDEVLQPMLASGFSKGKCWMTGTPTLEKNPKLDVTWEQWVVRDDRKTVHFEYDTAIEEGLLKEREVMDAMEKEGPDGEDFCKMYRAIFPVKGQRFYKRGYFENAFKKAESDFVLGKNQFFDEDSSYKTANPLILSADFGVYKDRFQILVGEVMTEYDINNNISTYVIYRYWFEASPEDNLTELSMAEIVKHVYWMFKQPKLYVDGNNQAIIGLLVSDGQYRGIERADFVTNEAGEKNGKLGIFIPNNIEKEVLHMNHRNLLIDQRIIPPRNSIFVSQWTNEHMSIDVKSGDKGYLFKKGSGPDDLAMASVYMSYHFSEENNKEPALIYFGNLRW